jgi:hypothetical protein
MRARSGQSSDAGRARSAWDRPRQEYVVANTVAGHSLANLINNAGAFVPQHHREGRPPIPVVDRPMVAVTHATCDDANENFILAR